MQLSDHIWCSLQLVAAQVTPQGRVMVACCMAHQQVALIVARTGRMEGARQALNAEVECSAGSRAPDVLCMPDLCSPQRTLPWHLPACSLYSYTWLLHKNTITPLRAVLHTLMTLNTVAVLCNLATDPLQSSLCSFHLRSAPLGPMPLTLAATASQHALTGSVCVSRLKKQQLEPCMAQLV